MCIPPSCQFALSCAPRFRCIFLVAIAVALLGLPAGAMPYMPAKWVQLRVSEEHGVEVVHVRNVDKLVNPERDHHHRQNKFLLLHQPDPLNATRFHPEPEGFDVYYELDGNEYHVHTAADPRWVIHEWLDDKGAVTGKRVKKTAGHFSVTIPRSATHVRVVPSEVRLEGRSAKVHTLHVPHDTDGEHGTKFAVKQVPDYVADLPQLDSKTAKPILSIIQTVGLMEEHKNIVFLSAGYTEAEQSKFDSEVGKLVDLMQGTIIDNEGRSAEPYHRYFSLLNIFAVFVADPQSGVHHPMAGGSVPQSVKPNYLDCSYGKTSERFLQCSDEKVKWLGSYAPPREENSVYAVLVNDELYGGTGGSRVCQFSHKASALLGLFIHEMGHADGGLLDEYDYGVTEPSQPKGLENCHWEESNPPWQRWIDLGKVGKPAPVCAYSNFYKPTNQTCQMFSNVLHKEFCAVCQEQQGIHIFADSKDLTSPRCPVNHEWLYVEVGKDATVYMNHRYLSQRQVYGSAYLQADLAKRYRVFNSSTTAFVTVPAADLQLGSNTLIVEIRDEIEWVLPEHRVSAMLFRAEFLIKVVNQLNTSGCQMKDCNIWRSQYLPYCATCQTNRTCNVTYEAAPFELQGAGNFVAEVQSFFATMAIVIGVGIAFFFIVVCGLGRLCKNDKAQIVRQAIWIKYMRNVMLFSSVVIMVSSVIALGYGVYLYSVNDVFGKAFDLILMGFSAIVYVVAFIGFIAALFRSKVLLFINGILLVWLFAAACFCTFEVFAIGGSITDPKWSNTVGKYWLAFTLSNPSDMCTLQFQLKCSGFTASCSTSSLSAYCPVNCDRSNKFAEPCYGFFTKIITNNFSTIGGLGIGMCVFLGFALIFNWVYCCTIERKDKARARYKAHKAGLRTEEHMPPHEMQAKLIDEEPGNVPFA